MPGSCRDLSPPGQSLPPSPPPDSRDGPSCPCVSLSCAPLSSVVDIWRRHLEAYRRCALELEASTSQMLNLSL